MLNQIKNKIQNFFYETNKFLFRNRFSYWVLCHTVPSFKFHLIDIRDKDYRYGWIDRDHAMFLACFKLLREVVEGENIFEHTVWEDVPELCEIKKIYEWWMKGREEEHAACEELRDSIPPIEFHVDELENGFSRWATEREAALQHPNWEKWVQMTDELAKKDDEMLLRLVQLRRYLWT
jgi:hypothetical protein